MHVPHPELVDNILQGGGWLVTFFAGLLSKVHQSKLQGNTQTVELLNTPLECGQISLDIPSPVGIENNDLRNVPRPS